MPVEIGDRVLSTWSLGNDAFAQPKVVCDVSHDVVYAGGVFYHINDVVIVQKANPLAKARREPILHDIRLAEDCAVALDELLRDDVIADDLPTWLIATANLVIDVI